MWFLGIIRFYAAQGDSKKIKARLHKNYANMHNSGRQISEFGVIVKLLLISPPI